MGTDRQADRRPREAEDPPDWVASEFPSETPAHTVSLTKGYWIDTTEVTIAAFKAFVDAGGYANQALWSEDGWAWLTTTGRQTPAAPLQRRRPAAAPDVPDLVRGGGLRALARRPPPDRGRVGVRGTRPEVHRLPVGQHLRSAKANVLNSVSPKPVGSYPAGASWVGALDMSGNAMEWVSDWLGVDYYATSPATDPTGPATGEKKVEKGGWWGSNEFVARSAYRHYEDPPTYGDHHIGFRVASQ